MTHYAQHSYVQWRHQGWALGALAPMFSEQHPRETFKVPQRERERLLKKNHYIIRLPSCFLQEIKCVSSVVLFLHFLLLTCDSDGRICSFSWGLMILAACTDLRIVFRNPGTNKERKSQFRRYGLSGVVSVDLMWSMKIFNYFMIVSCQLKVASPYISLALSILQGMVHCCADNMHHKKVKYIYIHTLVQVIASGDARTKITNVIRSV